MQTFSWSGHKNAILKKIEEFYINEIHTDCSFLVDGQYLRGHKTILCACSPFFEELFENESGKKAISLKDVKFSDLKTVFDFIYFGVVEIPLAQVTSFIKTSNLLQITRLGLINTNNNERQAETTGSFPTSAYVEGNSPRIKSEVQEEENNDLMKHINASDEEFLIPDDRDLFSDANEDAVFHSRFDLKSENRNDQEFSLPDFNPGQQMDNPKSNNTQLNDESATETYPVSPVVDINSMNIKDNVQEGDIDTEESQTKHCSDKVELLKKDCKEDGIDNNGSVFYSVYVKTENCEILDEAASLSVSSPLQQNILDEESGDNCAKLQRQEKEKQTPHSNALPFASDQSSAAFVQRTSLQSHQRTHMDEWPYKCDQCSAAFALKSQLNSHQRSHTGELPFACDQCPAAFSIKAHFQRHQRTHTGERPFACDQCSSSFSDKSSFMRHRRTHTKERPFACDKCPATFAQKTHLQNHQRTHTGERPFKCDQCPAAFSHKHVLKSHKRTHTGERPFACDQCPATFFRKAGLRDHQRSHTGERPYKCDICPSAFSSKIKVARHILTHKR